MSEINNYSSNVVNIHPNCYINQYIRGHYLVLLTVTQYDEDI